MLGLRLAPHIHYGIAGGERIFLDLESGRYFQLAPEDEKLFAALEEGRAVAASSAAKLAGTGLFTYSGDGRPIRPAHCPLARQSLVERSSAASRPNVSLLLQACADLFAARWMVARKRLPPPSLANSAGDGAGPGDDAMRLAASFLAARKFLPLAPNCLRDSLALHRFLKRKGVSATLVIGAKLHPFAAHCWLQRGDMVLNDSLSAARGFAPVLVL